MVTATSTTFCLLKSCQRLQRVSNIFIYFISQGTPTIIKTKRERGKKQKKQEDDIQDPAGWKKLQTFSIFLYFFL
jgi:hypothetical protein